MPLSALRRTSSTFRLTALWAMVSAERFRQSGVAQLELDQQLLHHRVVVHRTVAAGAGDRRDRLRRASTRERAWVGPAVVIYLMAMNWSVIGHVIRVMPLLDVTAHDKFRFVACFVAAAAGALWLDRAEERWVLMPVGVLIGGLAVYVWWSKPGVVRPIDLAGAATVIAFLFVPRRLAFGARHDRVVRPECGLQRTRRWTLLPAAAADHRGVAAARAGGAVSGRRARLVLLPNAAAQYGLEDIRGSDPMAFRWYVEALKPVALENRDFDVLRVGDVDHELIDFLNVRFVLAEPGAAFGANWRLIYHGADGTLFENSRARGRFSIAGGSTFVREDSSARRSR